MVSLKKYYVGHEQYQLVLFSSVGLSAIDFVDCERTCIFKLELVSLIWFSYKSNEVWLWIYLNFQIGAFSSLVFFTLDKEVWK